MSEELKDMLEAVSVPADLEEQVLGACRQATAAPKPRQKRLVPAVALVACAAVAATVWLSAGDLWQTAPAQKPTTATTTATAATTDSGTATQTTAPSATTTVSTKQTAATTTQTVAPPTQSVFVGQVEPQFWGDLTYAPEAFERVEGKLTYTQHLTVPPQTLDALPAAPEAGDITTAFDAATGTLTVSGNGAVSALYPREMTYSEGMTKAQTVAVDQTVKHLVIGEGITALYNAFNDLAALESVTFPETLTFMQDCFMDCDSLTAVTFPQSLTHLRYSCFCDCDSLASITFSAPVVLDNPVVRVPVEPFVNELGETVDCTYIGWTRAPFCDLASLTQVALPDGSSLFGAFANCQNLKKATLGTKNGGVAYIGNGDEYPTIPYKSALDTNTDLINGTESVTYFTSPFMCAHKDFRVYAYSLVYSKKCSVRFVQDWVAEARPDRLGEYAIVAHYIRTVPLEVNVAVGDGQVTLDWEAAEIDDEYYICRQEKGADGWTLIGSTADTTYTDTTVEKGKIYRYALKGPELLLTGDVENTKTYYYEERPFSYSCISDDCIVW